MRGEYHRTYVRNKAYTPSRPNLLMIVLLVFIISVPLLALALRIEYVLQEFL